MKIGDLVTSSVSWDYSKKFWCGVIIAISSPRWVTVAWSDGTCSYEHIEDLKDIT